MTSGASPKARLIEIIEALRKDIDDAPTQDEYVDPGAILIAHSILLLCEVMLVTNK